MSDTHEELTMGMLDGLDGKADTVRRMCRILGMVREKRVGWSTGPCDCVCPEKKSDPKNFRSKGDALRWLGPDDLQAMPSYEAADDNVRGLIEALYRPRTMALDVLCLPIVAVWLHGAKAHRAELAAQTGSKE